MIGDSNETNSPHKLLLFDTKFSRLQNAFASYSSVNLKQSTTQLSKMVQLGGLIYSFIFYLLDLVKAAKKVGKNEGKVVENK